MAPPLKAEAQEHLQKARWHAEFLGRIDAGTFPDWTLVVGFYVALHLVGARLEQDGIRVTTHKARRKQIRKHPQLKDCKAAYFSLQKASELARYSPELRPTGHYKATTASALLQGRLEKVRDTVSAHLGVPITLPSIR